MKILLTGHSGQIGAELAVSLSGIGEVIFFPRTMMDLSDLDQVRDVVRAVKPDLIVNAAGYTDIAKAESEPALALLINGEAPGVLAQEAQRLGTAIIHYSTDHVFDGAQSKPYNETAKPNPVNAYGRSKLFGEQAISRHCEAHWILRTSGIYHANGGNFMHAVIRMAQESPQLRVGSHPIGAPTWARTVSRITREMLLAHGRSDVANTLGHIRATSGIYHLSASGETSEQEYASFIVEHLRSRGMPVKAGAAAAIKPAAAPLGSIMPARSANSRLALDKLESCFKIRLPHWRSDARKCLDEIIDRTILPEVESRRGSAPGANRDISFLPINFADNRRNGR